MLPEEASMSLATSHGRQELVRSAWMGSTVGRARMMVNISTA